MSKIKSLQSDDVFFMTRALSLAKKGSGHVTPNPMVGCVIVKNGRIIGEGYHKKYGSAHAETNAFASIKNGSAKGSTLYVTLEPCHHYGNTPPCVDAVIRNGVKRVVMAMKDPDVRTAGKSIRKLKSHGIEVTVGVCENEARFLNRFFITRVTKGRPHVILKVAQSLDGKIAAKKNQRTTITGKATQKMVHELRRDAGVVLVGRRTVEIDDPLLNVRLVKGPQPWRVVLDSQLSLNPKAKLFDRPKSLVIIACAGNPNPKKKEIQKKQGIETWCIAQNPKKKTTLHLVLAELCAKKRNAVLVEGGGEIFQSFLTENLVDEIWLFQAPLFLGDEGVSWISKKSKIPSSFKVMSTQKVGTDVLTIFQIG